ncbi:glycosyltransferase family 4 protein [Flavobacteriaceae bacterium]|nr:glycosyltransferase family 4 protein [Flavobacteriaceae bacterium]
MKRRSIKVVRVSTVAMSLDILLKGQLKYLNKYFQVIAVASKDNHLNNIRNREGVETKSLKMKRHISIFQDFISLFKLYVYFKKFKPQIVHSITPKAGLLSMVAGYFAKVPVRIHSFTGLVFPTKSGWMQMLLIQMDKLLCNCATHIYPEGEGVKQDLLTYKITKKPLKVIHNGNINGIDLDFFNSKRFKDQLPVIRNELGVSPDDFVFVFIGRLVGDKGINELVAAFDKLSNIDTFKSMKLILVGPYENQLDPLEFNTMTTIKSNINIIATGYKDDVRPFLAVSNVFVFPSYREGFPNVVLQAGAMGLPCIVTDINGCNEIIRSDVNGIIIPVKDVQAIYNAMKKLVSDKSYYNKVQENSRQMIEKKYSQSELWNALLDEYNSLIELKINA